MLDSLLDATGAEFTPHGVCSGLPEAELTGQLGTRKSAATALLCAMDLRKQMQVSGDLGFSFHVNESTFQSQVKS